VGVGSRERRPPSGCLPAADCWAGNNQHTACCVGMLALIPGVAALQCSLAHRPLSLWLPLLLAVLGTSSHAGSQVGSLKSFAGTSFTGKRLFASEGDLAAASMPIGGGVTAPISAGRRRVAPMPADKSCNLVRGRACRLPPSSASDSLHAVCHMAFLRCCAARWGRMQSAAPLVAGSCQPATQPPPAGPRFVSQPPTRSPAAPLPCHQSSAPVTAAAGYLHANQHSHDAAAGLLQ
jgi:hypothetical protein